MAEGWARHLLSRDYAVFSAGIKAQGLNVIATEVMAEVGIDISSHYSKLIDDLPTVPWHAVITVCSAARESCPYTPGLALNLHHSFGDPPALALGKNREETLDIYRTVRDEIRDFVRELSSRITVV